MESRTFKCEGERNDHVHHYEQEFGNVFEMRESKCCAVLIKHRRKVEQVITLQMAQQPKIKNINVVPGQLFCRQCKSKSLLDKTNCIDDQDKFPSVTDTDNEFTKCQTPKKKLQSMKTLKSSIWDCVKDSESDSSDKNESESE